jgi:GNAT superfamily N-acetyltransferase
MLHLDALVDFEEIIIAVVVHDEFHRAGVGVARRLGNADGRLADFVAQLAEFIFEQRRRRFLDQFLVAALHRAVALAQMNDFALVVAENLNFDVVRILDEFFDVNAGIAKAFSASVRAV